MVLGRVIEIITWMVTYNEKDLFYKEIFREVQEAHNKFPDFFRMDTFIDSTHMKL